MLLSCISILLQLIAPQDTFKIIYGDTEYYDCRINKFNECSYSLKSNLKKGYYIVYKQILINTPTSPVVEFYINEQGNKHGATIVYTQSNGRIAWTGNYENGIRVGDWFNYAEGYLEQRLTFLNNSSYEVTSYSRNGQDSTTGFVQAGKRTVNGFHLAIITRKVITSTAIKMVIGLQ